MLPQSDPCCLSTLQVYISLQQRAGKRGSLQLKMEEISPKLAALSKSLIPMPGIGLPGQVRNHHTRTYAHIHTPSSWVGYAADIACSVVIFPGLTAVTEPSSPAVTHIFVTVLSCLHCLCGWYCKSLFYSCFAVSDGNDTEGVQHSPDPTNKDKAQENGLPWFGWQEVIFVMLSRVNLHLLGNKKERTNGCSNNRRAHVLKCLFFSLPRNGFDSLSML